MKLFRFAKLIAVVALFTIGACAPVTNIPQIDQQSAEDEAEKQRQFVISEQERLRERLERVGMPILLANTALCDRRNYYYGLQLVHAQDSSDEYRSAYKTHYNLTDDNIQIGRVMPESPAAEIGILAGDELVSIDGVPVEGGKKADDWIDEYYYGRPEEQIDMSVVIRRDGEFKTFDIKPKTICGYPMVMDNTDELNAYADGDRIFFSAAMIEFMADDDHLALVIGHELAHNTMDHIEKKQGNALGGVLVGAIFTVLTGVDMTGLGRDIAGSAFSQEFEAEADYVGVYYAARAGYDISDVAHLWRRMAARHPGSIDLAGTTHPSTAKRFLAIEATRDEILAKKAAGEPLEPDMVPIDLDEDVQATGDEIDIDR